MFRCTNLGVIIFYSIRFLSKKKIKPIFLLKKPKPVQTDRFWFGFLGQKPVQTDRFRFGFLGKKPVQTGLALFFRFGSVLAWFFPVWLGFFALVRFFASLTRFFFQFFSVWVRFYFFGFSLIKPKPNRTGWFFQNFNRFFFTIRFFWLFFFRFSWFFSFFLTPTQIDI